VGAINPEQMSNDLAQAIAKLINEPGLYQQLQAGAYSRAMQLGDFEGKLQWLLDRYRELVMQSSRP
jgi:hypothetical protein